MGSSGTGTASSPCGACKFLRRKCASDCIFAPYFSNEHGAARFAAIHKVFGASNASKLLLHVPQHDRCEAVVTIAYEAQARLCDPIYGCVAHIFALQQQVASLQAQLMQAKVQLARGLSGGSSRSMENLQQTTGNACDNLLQSYDINAARSTSPQSSLDCVDNSISSDGHESTQESSFEDFYVQMWSNKTRGMHSDQLSELQALASRMMRNQP